MFFECLPTFKKRQFSIYCFYGASRREQEVKRILIGTTHKSLYKNESRNTKKNKKQFSSGSHLCSVSNKIKLNKDDIYREKWKFISIKFVHLLQCRLNMLQEGWIEISQRNKNTPNFCFLRTIKSHEELTEYSNPLKQEAPDK